MRSIYVSLFYYKKFLLVFSYVCITAVLFVSLQSCAQPISQKEKVGDGGSRETQIEKNEPVPETVVERSPPKPLVGAPCRGVICGRKGVWTKREKSEERYCFVRQTKEVCDGQDNDCDGTVDQVDGREVCPKEEDMWVFDFSLKGISRVLISEKDEMFITTDNFSFFRENTWKAPELIHPKSNCVSYYRGSPTSQRGGSTLVRFNLKGYPEWLQPVCPLRRPIEGRMRSYLATVLMEKNSLYMVGYVDIPLGEINDINVYKGAYSLKYSFDGSPLWNRGYGAFGNPAALIGTSYLPDVGMVALGVARKNSRLDSFVMKGGGFLSVLNENSGVLQQVLDEPMLPGMPPDRMFFPRSLPMAADRSGSVYVYGWDDFLRVYGMKDKKLVQLKKLSYPKKEKNVIHVNREGEVYTFNREKGSYTKEDTKRKALWTSTPRIELDIKRTASWIQHVARDGSLFVMISFIGTLKLGSVSLTAKAGEMKGVVAKFDAQGKFVTWVTIKLTGAHIDPNELLRRDLIDFHGMAMDSKGHVYVAVSSDRRSSNKSATTHFDNKIKRTTISAGFLWKIPASAWKAKSP